MSDKLPKDLAMALWKLAKSGLETKERRQKKMKKRQRKKEVWKNVNPYWYRDHYAVKKSNNRWRRCQRLDYQLLMRELDKQMENEELVEHEC